MGIDIPLSLTHCLIYISFQGESMRVIGTMYANLNCIHIICTSFDLYNPFSLYWYYFCTVHHLFLTVFLNFKIYFYFPLTLCVLIGGDVIACALPDPLMSSPISCDIRFLKWDEW